MSKKNNRQGDEEMIRNLEYKIGRIVSDKLDERMENLSKNMIKSLFAQEVKDQSSSISQMLSEQTEKVVAEQIEKMKKEISEISPVIKVDDSSINKIMESNRSMVSHTEEYVSDQFKKLEDKAKKANKDALLRIIEGYERFLNVYAYYVQRKENFAEEFERFTNYRKYLEKELAKENVTFASMELGRKIDDSGEDDGDLKFVDILNINQCDDKEKWNTIKELKDSNYYEYEGEVIRKQRIILFGENDC